MPLRLRLAIWYGALTGLVVLLVSGLTYAVHSRALYDDLDRVLAGALGHVSEEYAAARGSYRVAELLSVSPAPDIVVHLRDREGRVLAASPNAVQGPFPDAAALGSQPSRPAFDPVVGLVPSLVDVGSLPDGSFSLVEGERGARWRVLVLPVDGLPEFLVAMAPLDRIDSAVSRFRVLVPLLALLGPGLTLGAGWVLAARALRPVKTLTQTAGTIARSQSFSQRVRIETDGDELGQLAAMFNTMLDSLAAAHRFQERFVADASHELRAPLTAIQANLDLLEHHPEMAPAERQEALGEASREAGRLARLVADLMVLARADAGVPLRRQPVELDGTLLDVVKEARHLAQGQRLDVTQLEPAVVQGDRDRLKQLLLILLDNAIKYTPAGGRIALEMRRDDGFVEVVVRDSGVGIPTEDLPRVFERFYRADPARGRDPGGTGLGLPIARWIAQQHRGDVTLVSAPHQGTTATVRLPVTA